MANSIVIFGASGDLTSRKLIPALYSLYCKKYLPADSVIVGVSRSPFTHEAWREALRETTRQFSRRYTEEKWNEFAKRIFYFSGDVSKPEDFVRLRQQLHVIEANENANRVYYLSVSPTLYASTIASMGEAHGTPIDGINEPPLKGNKRRRVVIEKPFGTDLETARQLNRQTHEVLDEGQVYRIDHYLGKETVQNLMVLRFANSIFEPIWNRNYIENVQISVAEEVTVGRRGDYYDSSGVLRDMFQNHLLQLLAITAMEAPAQFNAGLVRDEKVKVLRTVQPMTAKEINRNSLRARYRGYLDEPGVPSDSQTATFAALRLQLDSWRWSGVPFFLRSGKAMNCRTTEIVIQFRQPPTLLFASPHSLPPQANRLIIQIQPAEGIQLQFQTKVPDAGMKIRLTDLDFRFQREFTGEMPDAYQRLLLDAMNGDASLFIRGDEVELAWGIVDPILAQWGSDSGPPLFEYDPGEWGPTESNDWIRSFGHSWFDVCPVLS